MERAYKRRRIARGAKGGKKIIGSRGRRRLSWKKTSPRPREMLTITKTYMNENFAISDNTSGTNGYVVDFRAIYISDYNTLAGVFDQYRINSVKVYLIPKLNSNAPVPSTTSGTYIGVINPNVGILTSVIDYDSSATPVSTSQMMEYPGAKFTRGLQTHYRSFKPKVNLLQQTSAGTSVISQQSGSNPWIDCTTGDVSHRGMRFTIENSSQTSVLYDLVVKMNISFKCVH